MQFQLQMIGTGSAFAKSYYNNNALISYNGYSFMIDCGITAPWSLHRMNISMRDIQGVLVTHLHADHIGGLEEYALRMRYTYNIKPTLFIESSLIDTLWDNSLKGGMYHSLDGPQSLESYFEVVPLQAGIRQEIQPGFSVELIRTNHYASLPSFSIVLNDKVFYSGDVTFDLPLLQNIAYTRQCEYILHDCQLEGSGIVHTTLNELLRLPEDIQERILLMHYGDTMPAFVGRTGKMTFMEQHKPYHFHFPG
ncbi:MAG: beta-lactamase domain protein [Paenibacillus sp.]|jgi:ribonuclease BN (tRNA processing enzyme)|nr:beta-lactamase domain protein [Paenibacillus sp.]